MSAGDRHAECSTSNGAALTLPPYLFASLVFLLATAPAAAQAPCALEPCGVPVTFAWPGATPKSDTIKSGTTKSHTIKSDTITPAPSTLLPADTFAGALIGSFGGLLGGGYLGYVLTKTGQGDYDGALGAIYGGAFGSVVGTAAVSTAMSGMRTSAVFSRALGGAVLGLAGGVAGGAALAALTDSEKGFYVGWALGQATTTTITVLTGDFAGAS